MSSSGEGSFTIQIRQVCWSVVPVCGQARSGVDEGHYVGRSSVYIQPAWTTCSLVSPRRARSAIAPGGSFCVRSRRRHASWVKPGDSVCPAAQIQPKLKITCNRTHAHAHAHTRAKLLFWSVVHIPPICLFTRSSLLPFVWSP